MKLQAIGKGSDAEAALFLAANRLFHGLYPYTQLDYLGNFPSAAPGLVLLMAPFTMTKTFPLLIPFLVIVSAVIIKKISYTSSKANLYLLFLLSSPAFLQSMIQANDYLITGLLFSLLAVGLFYYWDKSRWGNALLIVLAGFLGCSRLNFFYFPLLLGFFLTRRNVKSAVTFAIPALMITLLLHAGFYWWDPHAYSPMQVATKQYSGTILYRFDTLFILVSASIAVAIITMIRVKNSLESWLFYLWLCLATPLIIGGVFFMMKSNWTLQSGMGLGYITLTAPILIMSLCLSVGKKIISTQI